MNNIAGISSPINVTGLTGQLGSGVEEDSALNFSDMLSGMIQEADDAYVVASEDTQAILSGEVDDLAQVMVNGTKSELSLNLVIQVRNKVIDAYSEIMRMQV